MIFTRSPMYDEPKFDWSNILFLYTISKLLVLLSFSWKQTVGTMLVAQNISFIKTGKTQFNNMWRKEKTKQENGFLNMKIEISQLY